MLEKQNSMLQKHVMLKKQDETIRVIREELKRKRREIGEKIDLLKEDLKDYMEVREIDP